MDINPFVLPPIRGIMQHPNEKWDCNWCFNVMPLKCEANTDYDFNTDTRYKFVLLYYECDCGWHKQHYGERMRIFEALEVNVI